MYQKIMRHQNGLLFLMSSVLAILVIAIMLGVSGKATLAKALATFPEAGNLTLVSDKGLPAAFEAGETIWFQKGEKGVNIQDEDGNTALVHPNRLARCAGWLD